MMKKRLAACLMLLALVLGMAAPQGALAATKKPVIYTGRISLDYGADSGTGVYYTPDVISPDSSVKRLGTLKAGSSIDIVDVLPNYLEINYGKRTGFVLRHRTSNIVAVDPVTTPRYGTVVSQYYTTLDRETQVMAAPEVGSEVLITLQAGTQLAFVDISGGWARLIFKRQFGYVDTANLPDLQMVAPNEQSGDQLTPLAVYNSFYNIAENDMNLNRIENIKVGVDRMDRVMQPGETLDFNGTVGPFSRRNGYLSSWGLFEGELVPSVGGGSCQLSSTLYNVVLQLTGLTVLARAPHGRNGAPYLPHGVDASSGDLNFIFRNDYDFAIRISSHVQDGVLFIAFYRDDIRS